MERTTPTPGSGGVESSAFDQCRRSVKPVSFEWTTSGFLHKIWGHPRKSADNPGDIKKALDALLAACHDAYHSDEHQPIEGVRRQRIGSNRDEVNGLRKSEKAHLTEVVSPRRPTVEVSDSGPEPGHGLRPGIRCQASARDRDRRSSRRPRRSSDRWDGDRERCFGPAHCYGKLVNR